MPAGHARTATWAGDRRICRDFRSEFARIKSDSRLYAACQATKQLPRARKRHDFCFPRGQGRRTYRDIARGVRNAGVVVGRALRRLASASRLV